MAEKRSGQGLSPEAQDSARRHLEAFIAAQPNQEDAVRKLGLTRPTLHDLRRGARGFGMKSLSALSAATGLSLDELAGKPMAEPPHGVADTELVPELEEAVEARAWSPGTVAKARDLRIAHADGRRLSKREWHELLAALELHGAASAALSTDAGDEEEQRILARQRRPR